MPRFKLYLVERPTRAAPILDALVNDPAVGLPRDVLDGFIVGKIEGPVLLLADDDHERVQGYWERCNRDGLAVCIFDHSTILDRLRDRIRNLGHPKPKAPSPSPSPRPNAPSSLLTPSVQKHEIALVEPGILDRLPRLRAALLGMVAFALLLGVAWWMVPPRDEPEAAASSQQAAPAPNAASGRPLRVHAGGGTQTAAQAPRADGHAGGGAGGVAPTALADDQRIEVEVSQHGDTSAPARSDRPSLVPLLLAFVAGLAGSWGAGEAVSRRGASMPRARRRAMVAGVATLAVLVTAVSIVVRVSALSPAPAQPAGPPPSESPQAPSAHPVAAAPAESGGPFARFLRRHRGTGAATPPPSFASLLAGWRARRVDSAAPAAREETAVAAAPDAGARRHRRRHRRHAESRHAAHASDRVATDAGSATARAESADAAALAETPVAAAGEAPAQGGPANAPAQGAASPSVARAQMAASAAATPPEPEAPPPHEAEQRRPHPVAARARARRSGPSPFVGLALGVLAGLALSPRWRAFARGGDA